MRALAMVRFMACLAGLLASCRRQGSEIAINGAGAVMAGGRA